MQTTVEATIMKVSECCATVVAFLPSPELSLLPSLIIGISISSIVLIYLVQKDTKRPLSEVIPMFFRQLFLKFPTDGKDLAKVKHRDLQEKVSLRWKNHPVSKCSDRIKQAVCVYINRSDFLSSEEKTNGTSRQHASIFSIKNLSSAAWWNEFDVFNREQKILKSNFPKIKEEFEKVFADFQKGICKQWCKVELMKGHCAVYPLITEGVINTFNCSACPATFKALADCQVLGLSGCVFGSAAFTLLYPDSSIGPVTGETNIRIKCDMVLQTTTKGHLEVSGQQRLWQEGDVLLYDDTHLHSAVVADTKDMTSLAKPLVLLTTDLWHPGLDGSEKTVLVQFFTA